MEAVIPDYINRPPQVQKGHIVLKETDWMNLTPGFEENKVRARIEDVFQGKTLVRNKK